MLTDERAFLLLRRVDLEDMGQRLIEDNIVSVSRQMIDKEASFAQTASANGAADPGHSAGGAMDVDRPEEEL